MTKLIASASNYLLQWKLMEFTTHLFAIMQILIENHWKVRKCKFLILLANFSRGNENCRIESWHVKLTKKLHFIKLLALCNGKATPQTFALCTGFSSLSTFFHKIGNSGKIGILIVLKYWNTLKHI